MWLCVFLIIYFKPVKGLNGQPMKNYYNDYYIFLQKEWCHKKWFIQAFCRRSLSPFFLSRGEGAATRNKCSLLTDKMITKCQISLIVRNPAWKFHEKKKQFRVRPYSSSFAVSSATQTRLDCQPFSLIVCTSYSTDLLKLLFWLCCLLPIIWLI